MRRTLGLMALVLPLALCAQPAEAADLDRPLHDRTYRHYRADSYWHWRYRAAYTRWMYNEYVRAGFPVRHRQFRTYARAYDCYHRDRHW